VTTGAATAPGGTPRKGLSTRAKLLIGAGVVLVIVIILGIAFGSEGQNNAYQPQNEFKLDPWVSIKLGSLDLSINKAVLYLFLASAATVATLVWVADRMQARPNRVQTAVETIYVFSRDGMTRNNMDPRMARKWFPVIATLFLFVWFSNLLGYLPLPTNTEHKVDIFGAHLPTFALYAATANISVTLVLTLFVWFSYHIEGIRSKGAGHYFSSFIPAGTPGGMRPVLFVIEVISHFVRIISLSVRLFANILAGHLLILFMGGGLVILLGLAALGPVTLLVAILFYIFEVVLIATLQAFIFAVLTAIYLGGATAEAH
jgi:F-type H+-transporting ATPase subunit a